MAYSTLSSLPRPFVLVPRFASGWSTGMLAFGSALWGYVSSDALATVGSSIAYFTDGYTLGMRKYDLIHQIDTNSTLTTILMITAVTSAGNDPRNATATSVWSS